MKKTILFAGLIFSSVTFSQIGKNLEAKLSGTATDPLNEYPKGMTAYSQTHSDATGMSGVYYLKYPVQFMYRNTMNAYKTFTVDQVTIEFDADHFAGRIHVVEDAVTKLVRNAGTNLSEVWDIYASGYKDVQKNVAKNYNFYMLEINCKNYTFGSVMGVSKKGGFNDGTLYRYIQDPDVLVFGKVMSGATEFTYSDQFSYGGNLNVFSKDKNKLADWDSTKILNTIIEYQKLAKDYTSKSMGDMVMLPKQAVNDDTREKEYFDIIMTMAAQDKPAAWADKFIYCYISADWKIEYKGDNISHRWCTVIAVSNGWTEGSGARYIPVTIKQNWEGNAYGKTYMAGFNGALVPISSETALEFQH